MMITTEIETGRESSSLGGVFAAPFRRTEFGVFIVVNVSMNHTVDEETGRRLSDTANSSWDI